MPIRFYLHTKVYSDGRRPIYLDARWGRSKAAGGEGESRLRLGTGQSCQPSNWREDKQRIKSAELNYAKMNRKLSELELAATTLLERAELDGTTYTPAQLAALLKPAPIRPEAVAEAQAAVRTVATLYKEWKQAYRAKLATKTLNGPQGLINRLAEWRPGVPARPEDFQPDAGGRCVLLEEFCTWCVEHARPPQTTTSRGIYNNTIGTYLKSLRKLLKLGGYKFDWIEDDFSEDVDREALSYAEVMQIYRHEPLEIKEGSTNYLSRQLVRDLFVFNCLTGPRYGNLATLKPSDVILETMTREETGETWQQPIIEYVQRKNRRQLRKIWVALDPVAYEIWQRYEGKLTVPANQTMNAQLKTLCRAAGLKREVTHVRGSGAERLETTIPLWKAISCHTARYTFVTLQYEGGTDIVFIQDSVGHASLTTTRKYLKTRMKERLASTLTAFDKLRERDAQQAH